MLYFNNAHPWGITPGDEYTMLDCMWRRIPQVAKRFLNNSAVCFSNAWSAYQTPKAHMLLWHLLSKTLEETHLPAMIMTSTSKTYTADTPRDYDLQYITNLRLQAEDPEDAKRIELIYLSRRYTTLRDHLIQYATEYPEALTRCEDLETLFNTNVFIFRDRYDNYSFITNDTAAIKIEKVIGLLPALYPQLRDALNNSISENSLHLQLALQAFYNENAEGLVPLYMYMMEQAETKAAEQIYEDFKTQLIAANQKDIRNIEDQVVEYNRRINRLLTEMADYQESIKELRATMLGYTLGTNTIDLSIIDAIKHMSNVQIMYVDNGKYTLRITTPILYYNVRDVQMYYKHTNRTNVVTQQPWMAQLIKETFIEQKYKLITTTDVTCPWTTNSNSYNCKEVQNELPNPHLAWYQCYSQAKQQYITAVNANNWQTAINSMIAACASITFTDSTVISRLINNLLDTRLNYRDIKCFQNVETGETFSAVDYRDKYIQNAQATVSAAIAEAQAQAQTQAEREAF